MKRVVFPGSFDPFHNGHKDIVDRALALFDEIIIAIGESNVKNNMFSLDEKINMIKSVFKGNEKVKVEAYRGLTVDFCKEKNVKYIIRGLRNPSDFEFEKSFVQANRQLSPEIEVFLILTSTDCSYISSSMVRDVIKHNGDYTKFVPWKL